MNKDAIINVKTKPYFVNQIVTSNDPPRGVSESIIGDVLACADDLGMLKFPPPYRAQSGELRRIIHSLRDNGVYADEKGNGACPPMTKSEIIEFLTDSVNAVYDR